MTPIRIMLTAIFLFHAAANFVGATDFTAPPRATENLRGESVIIPQTAPETRSFLLVTYFTMTFEDQLIAIVAIYDDPATRREIDYAEIYQGTGHLLGIAWLDEFGIRHGAVDYGLINENLGSVTGVLVLVDEGNPV